jgi:hypothetical protein
MECPVCLGDHFWCPVCVGQGVVPTDDDFVEPDGRDERLDQQRQKERLI